MKAGQASRTAELVCMGRALGHGASSVTRFADPTALTLLSPDARARVEAIRAGTAVKGMRAKVMRAYLERQSKIMVARTVVIDDTIREAAAPQLVILGAGLDGRAWRMPELHDTVVFEVDHPDSQRDKRARVAALAQTAREVRFVPVDFRRDGLDAALTKAGHDPARPTMWVWEGVVMYLTPADVTATLSVIGRRSAVGSRLNVMYFTAALKLKLIGLIVRFMGEPLRSTFTVEGMRALLERHGLRVLHDDALATIAGMLPNDIARAATVMTHMRIATAVRVA
jgi:methyltransferase (TIGR00027 family)